MESDRKGIYGPVKLGTPGVKELDGEGASPES